MFRLITLLALFLFVNFSIAYSQDQEIYQLRKYTFDSQQEMDMTDVFLKEKYLPMLKNNGFDKIGVFKNHKEDGDTTLQTYLLLPVNSLTDLHDMEESNLDIFPSEKHYSRLENIFMRAFSDMPILEPSPLDGNRSERIYELRSYESAFDQKFKNKVDMFNAGGEIILFDKLGFNAVFYAEVIAGGAMPNLMYMTTHANQEARDKNWKSFVDAPEWKMMSSLPKYQKNVSHIDIFFLYPTDYSDY